MKTCCLIFILIVLYSISYGQEADKLELKRNIDAGEVYKASDPEKKEKIFKEWVKKYPPSGFPKSLLFYEYLKEEIAKSFANAGNSAKAMQYAAQLDNGKYRAEALIEIGIALLQKNFTKEASDLFSQSRLKAISDKKSTDTIAAQKAQAAFVRSTNYLSEILYKQQKYFEVHDLLKEAYDSSQEVNKELSMNYARVLHVIGKYDLALQILEKVIMNRKGDVVARSLLKGVYDKLYYGKDWDQYINALDKKLYEQNKAELKDHLVSIKAPEFTLKDLDGKIISLSDYKGKTIVIDFWALWCIPCIQSFPYMQRAVQRYRDSSNVQFLFIHTWEKDLDPVKSARDFLERMSYDFYVLMDLKDPVTEVNKVINLFNVNNIPAKIIIDKKGMIRFKTEEQESGWEDPADKIRAMIELASEG